MVLSDGQCSLLVNTKRVLVSVMDATKTLPASWYISQNLYSLEQRAVFYKAWYLVGAVPRFPAGEDVEYEFAQVAISVRHDGNENFEVIRKSDVRSSRLKPRLLGSHCLLTLPRASYSTTT
jgi:hypothetical protein